METEIAKDSILDAIENRKIANQPHDVGLDIALIIIQDSDKPITEHPAVADIISKNIKLQAKVDRFEMIKGEFLRLTEWKV